MSGRVLLRARVSLSKNGCGLTVPSGFNCEGGRGVENDREETGDAILVICLHGTIKVTGTGTKYLKHSTSSLNNLQSCRVIK